MRKIIRLLLSLNILLLTIDSIKNKKEIKEIKQLIYENRTFIAENRKFILENRQMITNKNKENKEETNEQ